MPKKHRNAKISSRGTGKKEKRREAKALNDNDDNEILELYSRKKSRMDIPIAFFFMGAIVALAATLRQYLNTTNNADYQPPPTTNGTKKRTTSLSELFRIACRKTKLVYCEKGVFDFLDESRSIRTRSTTTSTLGDKKPLLNKGQLLLEVPRSVQTTTIDALRDQRLDQLLRQNPRHPNTGKPLHPKAFLAVHMAFELSRLEKTSDTERNGLDKLSPEGQLQRAYLEYLPSHEDFLHFHPVSRKTIEYRAREDSSANVEPTNTDIDTDLHLHLVPTASLTDHKVDQNFRYYLSEYHALCRASPDFQNLVPLEAWITSRLIVQTRSFQSTPLTEDDISDEELDSYRPFLSEKGPGLQEVVDAAAADDLLSQAQETTSAFYEKCRKSLMRSCMVPLMDAFDHHHKANIGWKSMESQSTLNDAKSFINFATEDINADSELSQSYFSWRPDPNVFANYGFVNPYGLGDRAALLAPYHRLLDEDFETTNGINRDNDLHKYLAFRDGYVACEASRNGNDDEADQRIAFESAKFDALKAISNIDDWWVATLPPRDREGGGDLRRVLSMCRLLAMTHRDYAGRATEVLRAMADSEYPQGYQFQTSSDEATSDGLEYRACHVLERLAREMRSKIVASLASLMPLEDLEDTMDNDHHHHGRIGVDVDVDMLRHKLETSKIDPSSWEGTSILVRLGELETLTILCENAEDRKRELLSNKERRIRAKGKPTVNDDDYIVRLAPCY